MKKLIFIFLASSLVGCAGQKIVLKNAEGEKVTCEYSTATAMLTGAAMRNAKMKQCTQKYEAQGFTEVVEAGHKI